MNPVSKRVRMLSKVWKKKKRMQWFKNYLKPIQTTYEMLKLSSFIWWQHNKNRHNSVLEISTWTQEHLWKPFARHRIQLQVKPLQWKKNTFKQNPGALQSSLGQSSFKSPGENLALNKPIFVNHCRSLGCCVQGPAYFTRQYQTTFFVC